MTLLYPADGAQDGDGPGTHVLIVAVGGYDHLIGRRKSLGKSLAEYTMGMEQLSSPVPSAVALTDWFMSRAGNDGFHNPHAPLATIEALVSSHEDDAFIDSSGVTVDSARLQNIRDCYEKWRDRLARHKQNIGVFYFSGHGVSKLSDYVLPCDFGRTNDNPFADAIDIAETARATRREVPGALYFFIDACRVTPRELLDSGARPQPLHHLNFTKQAVSSSWTMIWATGLGRKAFGDPNGTTRFSSALLQALSGFRAEALDGEDGWPVRGSTLGSSIDAILEDGNRELEEQEHQHVEINTIGSAVLHYEREVPRHVVTADARPHTISQIRSALAESVDATALPRPVVERLIEDMEAGAVAIGDVKSEVRRRLATYEELKRSATDLELGQSDRVVSLVDEGKWIEASALLDVLKDAASARRDEARLRGSIATDDPAVRVALLREVENTAEADWVNLASAALRGPTWQFSIPTDGASLSPIVLTDDGRMLTGRSFESECLLVHWRVDSPGQPRHDRIKGVQTGSRSRISNVWIGVDELTDHLWAMRPDGLLESLQITADNEPEDHERRETVEHRPTGEIVTHYQRVQISQLGVVDAFGDKFDPDTHLVVGVGHAASARRVLTQHKDGSLRLWTLNATEGSEPIELPLLAPVSGEMGSIAMSSDGAAAVLIDHPNDHAAWLLRLPPTVAEPSYSRLGSGVTAVDFHPDGDLVATGHEDGSAVLWTREGDRVATRAERGPALTVIKFSRDGTQIGHGNTVGEIALWPFDRENSDGLWTERWQPGDVVLRTDTLWADTKLQTHGEPLRLMVGQSDVRKILFDQNSDRVVALCDGDAVIFRSDGTSTPARLEGHRHPVMDACFSRDGERLITSSQDAPARVWAPTAGEQRRITPPAPQASVSKIAVDHGLDHDQVWIEWGNIIQEFHGPSAAGDPIKFTHFLHDALSARSFSDSQLRWKSWQADGREASVCRMRGGIEVRELTGVTDQIISIAATADFDIVAAATKGGGAWLWTAGEDDPIEIGTANEGASSVAISGDDHLLAMGTRSGVVLVLDLARLDDPLVTAKGPGLIRRIDFSPDGEAVLARGASSSLFVTMTGAEPVLVGGSASVAFVDGGRSLLLVSRSEVVELHKDGSQRLRRTFRADPGNLLTISPTGEWAATRTRDDVLLWDLRSDREPARLGAGSTTTKACSSPDGKRLYTGHQSGHVLIWDVDLDPASLLERLREASPYRLTVEERMEYLREDRDIAISNQAALEGVDIL